MQRPDFDPFLIQSLEPVSSADDIIDVDPVDPFPNQIEPELAEAGTQNERENTWENYLKNLSHMSYVGKMTPDGGGFHTIDDMAYIIHMEPTNALGYAPCGSWFNGDCTPGICSGDACCAPRCSQCGHIRPNSKCCEEKGCYKGGDIICVKKEEKCP
jgi:hypothetical protein